VPVPEAILKERYRRAPTVAFGFEGPSFGGGNWYTGTWETLDPRDAWVLAMLGDWTTPAEAARRHPLFEDRVDMAASELERLARAGLVVRASEGEGAAGRFAAHWREWGLGTQVFHATSRDAPYAETVEDSRTVYRSLAAQPPAPDPVKTYPGAERIELPRDLPPLDAHLETVLASRRTWRAFTGGEVSIRRFSKLMLASFGIMGEADTGPMGRLLFKTSPSGGARHPTEAYVVATAVEGVAPGVYHYDPRGHALERLSLGDHREDVVRWLSNQPWFARASFYVFLTSVVRRLSYKYKHGRAYRILLLDQGHVGQTFVLAATALGLGAFQTAAFHDTEVERALGVDGVEEVALYALGAGTTPIPVLYPGKAIELWDREPKRIDIPPWW
jgi:SagB-type dehydrogenase family enzyme